MAKTTNKVALQTLQDYLLDVKPYHTKLRALQADYVFEDQLDINFLEDVPTTYVDLQNYWTKNDAGGWRLINVSDGTAASKKYRIPATVVPRFSLDTYTDQMIKGDDPATPSLINPWFGANDTESWKNHWSYSHQLGSDQVPHELSIYDQSFTMLSYFNPTGDKYVWAYNFTADYFVNVAFEDTVMGYDVNNLVFRDMTGAIRTSGSDYTYNTGTRQVSLTQTIEVLVEFMFEGFDTTGWDTTEWGSSLPIRLTVNGYNTSWSTIIDGGRIPNFNWLANNLSLTIDQTQMMIALRPYVLELLRRRNLLTPFVDQSGQYAVPMHNGSFVVVNGTPANFGTEYITNKERNRIIFLDGYRPGATDELRINYFTVDWLLMSVNAPFEANVATTYDDNRYDIPKFDSQLNGLVLNSDYFSLVVNHSLPESYSVSFHPITETDQQKGELTSVVIQSDAPAETWTITALTPYQFSVVGSVSGELPNVHPLGGTGTAQALFGRPFDNGKIAFTIKNVFHPYYIIPDLNTYASMDYEMFNVFMFSGTRDYPDFLPSLNVDANYAPFPLIGATSIEHSAGTLTAAFTQYKISVVTRAAESPAATLAGPMNPGQNAWDINWSTIPAAIAYNIYGRSGGSEVLLASIPGNVGRVIDLGGFFVYNDPETGFEVKVATLVSTQTPPSGIPVTATNPPVQFRGIGKITMAYETNNATATPTANQRYWIFEFDEPPPRGALVEFIVQQNDQFNTLMLVHMKEKFKILERLGPHEWVDLASEGYDIPDFDTKPIDKSLRLPDGTLNTNDTVYTRTGIIDDLYYRVIQDGVTSYVHDGYLGTENMYTQGSWVMAGGSTINGVHELKLYHQYGVVPTVVVKVGGVTQVEGVDYEADIDEARIIIVFPAATEFEVFVS